MSSRAREKCLFINEDDLRGLYIDYNSLFKINIISVFSLFPKEINQEDNHTKKMNNHLLVSSSLFFAITDRAVIFKKIVFIISAIIILYVIIGEILAWKKLIKKRREEAEEDAINPKIYVHSYMRHKNSRRPKYVKGYYRRKYKIGKR